MSKGRINVYRCPKGHDLVTRDVHDGVTPMFKSCPTCGRQACSQFYADHLQGLTPTHEWYKPKWPNRLKDGGLRQHCESGGLLFRKVGEGDETENLPAPTIPKKDLFSKLTRRALGMKG